METIYYFKTISGAARFSSGKVCRTDEQLGQHLRVLRRLGKTTERLYLDHPEQFKTIQRLFPDLRGKSWRDIYDEN